MSISVSSLWQSLLQFFFPKKCCGCQTEGFLICKKCLNRIEIRPKKTYVQKRYPVQSYIPYTDKTFAKSIWKGKYKFSLEIFQILTPLLFDYFPPADFPEKGVLVPIPLHFFRTQKRGYNQSEIIALSLESAFPEYQTKNLLKRVKNTRQQARLHKTQREKNILGAITIQKEKEVSLPKNTPIILVDDVITTGSTLQECFRVLSKAGYTRLYGVTLGYG